MRKKSDIEKAYPSKEALEIPSEWSLMIVEDEEGPMVLRMNHGYKDLIGHPEYNFQVGVAVPLNNPTEAGFHEEEEGLEVAVIEEQLVELLQNDKLALFVFSQCSGGGKEWVFYTGNPDEVEKRIEAVRNSVTTHTLQNFSQEDPDWEIYQEFGGGSDQDL
ncbi:MAG: DUF695 domain-containing protein [Verrucomicrobiota bacterium]